MKWTKQHVNNTNGAILCSPLNKRTYESSKTLRTAKLWIGLKWYSERASISLPKVNPATP